MEIIKLLVRIVIAFIGLYQLLSVDCKVIKHSDEISTEAKHGEPSKWHHLGMSGSFEETSIKQTNSTSTTNINSLATHMPFLLQRSFKKVHSIKRSLKKMWLAYAYYAPEFSLCSCLFKYAWHTYPIIPEVTYSAMGRAQRMVGHFMQEFVQGYMNSLMQYDQERISAKVAQTTADDYYDYQNRFTSNYGPQRRNDEHVQPPNQKIDPKIAAVVEMLKNLKPKANQSDSFVIRYARALHSLGLDGDQNYPMSIVMEIIRKFLQKSHDDTAKSSRSLNRTRNVEGRGFVSPNGQYVSHNSQNIRRIHTQGPPSGLPSYDELPPADYNYVKDGVHYHVHDLRKNKRQPNGGGWFNVDFQDSILQTLGLASPGVAIKPTLIKCGKGYALNIVLRHLQALLLGG